MAQFHIEMPHTIEQCLQALEQTAEKSPELLRNTWWGCPAGTHTGWAMVEADSASDARNMVPSNLRNQAAVTEVRKFTQDEINEIKEMHGKAA